MKRYIFLIVMLISWLNISAAKINQKIDQLYDRIDSSNIIIRIIVDSRECKNK